MNDLNKNGKKDVYEDPKADVEKRIDDLLSQMTVDEKTCQTATLYGYNRILKDPIPTPAWKNSIWKDGIANIDQQDNGWDTKDPDNPYVTDIKKHVWAMNEVQRFFIEETRLGIPADFTNEGVRGVAFHDRDQLSISACTRKHMGSRFCPPGRTHYRTRGTGPRVHQHLCTDNGYGTRPALGPI